MAIKKESKKVIVTQNDTLPDIEKEFALIFTTLKSELSNKKFEHRIKKALKILTHGLGKKKESKPKAAKSSNIIAKKKKAVAKKKAIKK